MQAKCTLHPSSFTPTASRHPGHLPIHTQSHPVSLIPNATPSNTTHDQTKDFLLGLRVHLQAHLCLENPGSKAARPLCECNLAAALWVSVRAGAGAGAGEKRYAGCIMLIKDGP